MMRTNLRATVVRASVAALVVAGVAGLVGCGGLVQAQRPVELSAVWSQYEQIVVRSRNGRVELYPYDGAGLRVSGTLRAHGASLAEAQRNLDELHVLAGADPGNAASCAVTLEYPPSRESMSVGADLVVQIPESCKVDIATSNGSVCVRDLSHDVRLVTGNGRIEAVSIGGNVVAATSNGNISVKNARGEFSAVTSNGSVSARAVGGKCEVETSNGGVQVVDARGDVVVTTSNGSIYVEALPPETGNVILSTSNASIEAVLPASMKADVDLRTSNGRVRTSISKSVLSVADSSNTHLVGSLNGKGGGKIVARSSNGSVALTCR